MLPPSIDNRLAERHWARVIVEVVGGLELSELEKAYAGRGSSAYLRSRLL
ncbi:IS5/IS1182 family transposase, partial [Pseudomonas stutzeri]|nr:IS5/IS1182 family transposase [Stutzerimonas stutzeri]